MAVDVVELELPLELVPEPPWLWPLWLPPVVPGLGVLLLMNWSQSWSSGGGGRRPPPQGGAVVGAVGLVELVPDPDVVVPELGVE